MQKLTRSFLLLMIITGVIFSGCSSVRTNDHQEQDFMESVDEGSNGENPSESGVTSRSTVSIVIGEESEPVVEEDSNSEEENENEEDSPGAGSYQVSAVIPEGDEEEVSTATDEPPQDLPKYVSGGVRRMGTYETPAGTEEVEIRMDINEGVITAATAISHANHETSKIYQGQFIEGFSEMVVGKNLDEVELRVVNGSSLTPKGFNEVLEGVKADYLN